MSWRSRWWFVAVVSGALLIGTGPLYAGYFGFPRAGFAPLALAGLVAAASIGVQRVASTSRSSRLRSGCRWAALWLALLPVPWAARFGVFYWGAVTAPAPSGAVRLPGFDPLVEDGIFDNEPVMNTGGYQVVWQSGLPVAEVERFYRDVLPRRGWRLQWSRDVAFPASGGVRMICFRRADGYLVLRIGTGQNTGFGLVYDHFAPAGQYR